MKIQITLSLFILDRFVNLKKNSFRVKSFNLGLTLFKRTFLKFYFKNSLDIIKIPMIIFVIK